MQIEKAYLFGKTLKSGVVPPTPAHEHWLYYNGAFNTELMPSGFTNFDDMLVTFTGATGTMNYQIQYANTNFLRDYMGTPHIVQFVGTPADSWELTNNILKRVQTGTIPSDAEVWNYYHAAILFPLNIPNTFSKAHIKYEYIGEALDLIYKANCIMRAQTNSGALATHSENESYPSTAGEYEDEVDIYQLSQSYIGYAYFQFEPYLVTREVIVKEIWFE